MCLGDSITEHGDAPGGYVWLLREALRPIEVINAGVSGHRSREMLARLQKDVLDLSPDLVLISCGVNDVWHGFDDAHPLGDGPGRVPLDEYGENMLAIVRGVQGVGAKAVLLTATVIGEDLSGPMNVAAEPYNERLRSVAAETGAHLIDLQVPFRALIAAYRNTTGSSGDFLTTDGVHLNGAGNQLMGSAIRDAIS